MPDIPENNMQGRDETKAPNYRVLLFDRAGKVHSSAPIPVGDDESAKVVARRMANGLSAELWDGLRYIDQFDGTDANLVARTKAPREP